MSSIAAVPTARTIRPTRVEVDLDAIVDNARLLRRFAGAQLYAVVKADGYGHGAAPVARALAAAGAADRFAVSLVEEGLALRAAGLAAPILVMGPSLHGGADEILARGLSAVVSDRADWDELAAAVRARGGTVEVHLKVDTGMGRLGLTIDDAVALAARAATDGLRVVGLMTHFANADSDDPADPSSLTYAQLARFADAERALARAGVRVAVRHAANSSGTMLFPGARFEAVRCGIAMYGNGRWSTDATLPGKRRQALRLVTQIAQLREVPVGSTVGYGALWMAERPTRLAVLPLGYADGLPRRATAKAEVAIRDQRCPLVGAISMDIAIADVTDLGGAVAVGDDAVVLGGDGAAAIPAAEYAAWSGLTEYEVTCGISKRVPRVYSGAIAAAIGVAPP
jgi:alanine racemase